MVRGFIYRNVETSAGAHLASYSIRIEDSFPRVKPPERAAAIHLHLVLWFRMIGAILLLLLYAYMACIGTIL
jgi:hypothetical protein